jgi:hypothetical protein
MEWTRLPLEQVEGLRGKFSRTVEATLFDRKKRLSVKTHGLVDRFGIVNHVYIGFRT